MFKIQIGNTCSAGENAKINSTAVGLPYIQGYGHELEVVFLGYCGGGLVAWWIFIFWVGRGVCGLFFFFPIDKILLKAVVCD